MIVSEVFDIKFENNLTKETIEDYFKKNNLSVVKWSVIKVFENFAKISASIEKKTL